MAGLFYMSDSNHFYNKIIDEEKVAALFKENPKEANRPHRFWFLSLLFSLFTVFIATFHGYRFENNKVSIAFIVVLALASISLIFWNLLLRDYDRLLDTSEKEVSDTLRDYPDAFDGNLCGYALLDH